VDIFLTLIFVQEGSVRQRHEITTVPSSIRLGNYSSKSLIRKYLCHFKKNQVRSSFENKLRLTRT